MMVAWPGWFIEIFKIFHILKGEPTRFTDRLDWDMRKRDELRMMKDLV